MRWHFTYYMTQQLFLLGLAWMGKYSRKCAGHCAATFALIALNTFWLQHVNTSVNEIKQGQNR